MACIQTKSFIESKGGTVKGDCLKNTREGYIIPAKYPTAWEAWRHTQQHLGTAPANVDVPLFFSYWATINGEYKNWGHIGVRLRNGEFWSDGKTYDNVGAYLVLHPKVKYVGYGESINDVQVIKFVADPNPVVPKMPPLNSRIQLIPTQTRTTFKKSTTTTAGHIKVTDNSFIYVVRGYDPKYPGRIIINTASGGGNGVALALYYTNGAIIPGWKRL